MDFLFLPFLGFLFLQLGSKPSPGTNSFYNVKKGKRRKGAKNRITWLTSLFAVWLLPKFFLLGKKIPSNTEKMAAAEAASFIKRDGKRQQQQQKKMINEVSATEKKKRRSQEWEEEKIGEVLE